MNQREQIFDYLLRFKTITPMEAFADLGITKLSTRIGEMRRKDGVEFNIEMVKGKNRLGKPTRYAKYSLKEVENEI